METPLSRRSLLGLGSVASDPAPSCGASVSDRCLAVNNIHCRSCEDFCAERAIRFPPLLGRMAVPVIDDATCTGCGDCVAGCPVGAVRLVPTAVREHV